MDKITTPIAVLLSGILIFFGLYMNDLDARMSMDDKSCCCKSDATSCSMNKENDNHSKNDSHKGCSMCMKNNKGNQKDMFDKLDTNSDGKISISEFLTNPDKKFNSLDVNKDGYISKDELFKKKSSDAHAHH
tara:strand:- start:71 stop:466 length:396 start_codon:yes stop_codon:yes gene_type:complete